MCLLLKFNRRHYCSGYESFILSSIYYLLFSDLNYLEESARGPTLTVATLPKSGKIVLLQVIYTISCHVSI